MPASRPLAALRRISALAQTKLPDMTVRSLVVLLAVAEDEGKTVGDYATATGFPLQTASRILQDLSGRSRPGQTIQRENLLFRSNDPMDLRAVVYNLTPQGRALVNQMAKVVEDAARH